VAQVVVDYKQAFKNLGLNFDPLFDKGMTISMTTVGMKFLSGGEVLASLPIPPGKISEIEAGFNPQSQSQMSIKASLQGVLVNLKKKMIDPPIQHAQAEKYSPPVEPAKQPTSYGAVEVYPQASMKIDSPVKLVYATQLFQPVAGTSQGSRYFVVGIGEGVVVAARMKSGTLSVRVEGTQFSKLAQKIADAGVFGPAFGGSFEGGYASMHLEVDGKNEATRVIGAVLASLAPYIKHPTPDIQPIMDVAA
jgi:hypothetical protein